MKGFCLYKMVLTSEKIYGIFGIFTRRLLLSLASKADLDNDWFITASEIGTYIRPTVSRKTQNVQTPKFGWITGEGDFIFENLTPGTGEIPSPRPIS